MRGKSRTVCTPLAWPTQRWMQRFGMKQSCAPSPGRSPLGGAHHGRPSQSTPVPLPWNVVVAPPASVWRSCFGGSRWLILRSSRRSWSSFSS